MSSDRASDNLDAYEAPYLKQLRAICEEIGYGRVIQVTEHWMDRKHPGWLKAKHQVIKDGKDEAAPVILHLGVP